MNWRLGINYLGEAFKTMKAQRLRSFITVMIIAIGILALVSTLTVVEALHSTFTGNLKETGANTFTIQRYGNSLFRGRRHGRFNRKVVNPPITYRETKAFKEKYKFPDTKTSVSLQVTSSAEIGGNGKKTGNNVKITGGDENFINVYHYRIAKGRSFSINEVTQNAPVAIAGPETVKTLFGKENPIGKYVFYKGHKWKIIGVTESKGSVFGGNEDNFLIIPLGTARLLSSGGFNVFRIRVAVEQPETFQAAKDKAVLVMRQIRHLKPSAENNFGIRSSEQDLKDLENMDKILKSAAFVIGLITIFASSVALMNIMLVTVTERIREIGIRKAVGASMAAIRFQFLTETLAIALAGAIVGILLGIFSGWAVARVLKMHFTMPWSAVFWAIVLTFITALVSGFYPAVKASRANPIEALRYE